MKIKSLILKISYIALFSALTFIGAYFIVIPYASGSGYFNLSDLFIIFSSIYFGPIIGIFSGIIGSSLSDLLLGYAFTIPFTIVAKSLEALVAFIIFKLFFKKPILRNCLLYLSIIPMVLTYLINYLILYDFSFLSSYSYSLFDILQGILNVSGALLILFIFKNINIKEKYDFLKHQEEIKK